MDDKKLTWKWLRTFYFYFHPKFCAPDSQRELKLRGFPSKKMGSHFAALLRRRCDSIIAMSQALSLKEQQGHEQQRQKPTVSTEVAGSTVESDHSIYSQVVFHKELAQSSLISGGTDRRSASQFYVRPKTLFDDCEDRGNGTLVSEHLLLDGWLSWLFRFVALWTAADPTATAIPATPSSTTACAVSAKTFDGSKAGKNSRALAYLFEIPPTHSPLVVLETRYWQSRRRRRI